ncbi:MAG: hypothetical protein KH841_09495, partial [Collinsella sp.]|nr:hypothetical protein [Collinsella sp.]
FVLFGDRKSYTGHGPCLYLRPSTNLRKISGVINPLNMYSKFKNNKSINGDVLQPLSDERKGSL